MPITLLDIILIGVMLISGLLAMIRGFMREILSIAAWLIAAVVTLYFYAKLLPFAKSYFNNDIIAAAVVVGGTFLITLLIISVMTVRFSDMVLDSRIGALDRTLGFLFGLVRGLIIVVIAFLFFAWLVPDRSQPDWVRSAKSRVVLQGTGDWLMSMLPDDPESTILKRLKKPKLDEDEPAAGQRFDSERRLGLVGDNFSRREVIERLPGLSAMGHVRYSTTGETVLRNVQPLFAELDGGGFAIGHNGNLTNGLTLRRQLIRDGAIMQSTSDTEVILHLVAHAKRNRFIDRFIEGLRQLEGAYAFVGLTNKKLVGARDPLGIRPLVIGTLDGRPILASETCALDTIGAKYLRDVENGEVIVFDEDGMHSHQPFPPMAPRPCIFEYIYFARPDSVVGGRSVYDVRKTMGAELACEAPAAADVVIPVPDSGVPAAIGYAQASAIPYELGIIRNHYVGRTFIEPTQHIRQLGVRLKHSANRAVVQGKRIVLIDDSIVRGTTSFKIVQMMREAGAKEVHFRIASPPITHSDYYGIDTPERDNLLAATHDLEGMRSFIGADSLAFLSVEGIYRAMGYERRDPLRPQFTDHCFTGDYPTDLTDQSARTTSARQLSLLAEAS